MKTEALLQELKKDLRDQRSYLAILQKANDNLLNQRPEENAWSALECAAHLNSYAAHYVPAFTRAMQEAKASNRKSNPEFKGTWLGRYCIQSVLPENRKKKMKTPARHNHLHSNLRMDELNNLEANLKALDHMLDEALTYDLNRIKVQIEIMPLLKLRLGDFFPFLIKHQSRHLHQALEAAGIPIPTR